MSSGLEAGTLASLEAERDMLSTRPIPTVSSQRGVVVELTMAV